MVVGTQVSISYLEIYNEVGYDLLDPGRDIRGLEDLQRVQVSSVPRSALTHAYQPFV